MKNNWFDKDKIEYIKYIMPFFFALSIKYLTRSEPQIFCR